MAANLKSNNENITNKFILATGQAGHMDLHDKVRKILLQVLNDLQRNENELPWYEFEYSKNDNAHDFISHRTSNIDEALTLVLDYLQSSRTTNQIFVEENPNIGWKHVLEAFRNVLLLKDIFYPIIGEGELSTLSYIWFEEESFKLSLSKLEDG